MAKYGTKDIILAGPGDKVPEGTAVGVLFTFPGSGSIHVLLSEMPGYDIDSPPMGQIARAACHGVSQKVGDAYSASDDVTDPASAMRAASDMKAQIIGGDWNAKAERGSMLVDAIVLVTGADETVVRERWARMDAKQKAAIRKDPQVAAKVAELELARKRAKAKGAESSLKGLFD